MTTTRRSFDPFVAAALTLVVASAVWVSPVMAQDQLRADLNGDEIDDLAIGVPDEMSSSGGVNIIYGSPRMAIRG
jgi:hypothetical protein